MFFVVCFPSDVASTSIDNGMTMLVSSGIDCLFGACWERFILVRTRLSLESLQGCSFGFGWLCEVRFGALVVRCISQLDKVSLCNEEITSFFDFLRFKESLERLEELFKVGCIIKLFVLLVETTDIRIKLKKLAWVTYLLRLWLSTCFIDFFLSFVASLVSLPQPPYSGNQWLGNGSEWLSLGECVQSLGRTFFCW